MIEDIEKKLKDYSNSDYRVTVELTTAKTGEFIYIMATKEKDFVLEKIKKCLKEYGKMNKIRLTFWDGGAVKGDFWFYKVVS